MKFYKSARILNNQTGIAHLALIILGVLGIVVALFLVGTRTNFSPSAQQDMNLNPQTAFHLFLSQNYSLISNDGRDVVVYDEPGDQVNNTFPKRSWFYPGEEIRVNVSVSADVDPVNSFTAVVNYPNDLLEAVSIIKGDLFNIDKHPKIESVLLQLYKHVYSDRKQSIELVADRLGLEVTGGKVKVVLEMSGSSRPNLRDYGFEETASYANLLDGYVTIDSLLKLADLPDISYIRAPIRPMPDNGGSMTDAQTIFNSLGNSASENLNQNARSEMCVQVVTKACGTVYNDCKPGPDHACERSEWESRPECKEFPTPCDVPEGWEIEDQNLKGKRYCDDTRSCPNGYFCKSRSSCNAGGTACTDVYGGDCYPVPNSSPSSKPSPMDCRLVDCAPQPVPSGCTLVSDGSCCGGKVFCEETLKQPADYFIQNWLPETKIDLAGGRVILAGGVNNPGVKTTPPAKPIMATIVFKAKKAGDAGLAFTDGSLILRSSDSANILSGKNGIVVSIKNVDAISMEGDMDGDGKVGFNDFSYLLSKWGTDDKKADLTGDGKVNIYDLSKMLLNWNGKRKTG